MKIYQLPKIFTANYVEDFLKTIEPTIHWKKKLIPDVHINLSKIERIDIVGLLLIYKYIDYTHKNYCFKKPNLITDTFIENEWVRYEFEELIKAYIANKEVTDSPFKEFRVKVNDKFIIAPQALLRGTSYSNEYLRKEFIPKIEGYYNPNSKSVDLIFSCFSEVLLNFWEHADQDTKSVIIADGNRMKIEIACADTGIGLLSNMKKLFNKTIGEDKLISKAIEKGVTSKPNTFHMGYGLWLVSELVKANNGKFHIYSQGYYYRNTFGKIRSGKCSYWPGTIVYVYLDLKAPKTISDITNKENFNNLKINFK